MTFRAKKDCEKGRTASQAEAANNINFIYYTGKTQDSCKKKTVRKRGRQKQNE